MVACKKKKKKKKKDEEEEEKKEDEDEEEEAQVKEKFKEDVNVAYTNICDRAMSAK